MRLLRAIVVLGLCVAGIGLYRGWFSVSSHGREAGGGKVNIDLTMDRDKMKDDTEKVKEKTTELGNSAKDKVKSIGN